MGILIVIAIVLIAFVAFDLAAMRWGADSREYFPREHHLQTSREAHLMHSIFLYSQAVQSDRVHGSNPKSTACSWRQRARRARDPSHVRRAMALVLAALSRGSAAAVRRLDECVADDIGRALAPSE